MAVDNIPNPSEIPTNWTTPPMVQPSQDKGISLVRELSPQEPLREMMEQLRGRIFDPIKKVYIQMEGASPIMNAEGIDAFFHYATAIISSITTMSNYTQDYKIIHALVLMQAKRASIHFHLHYKDYGIKRKTKILMVIDKLMILGLSAFYKALGAGDRKASTANISESINRMQRDTWGEEPSQQSKRRGFLSRMMGK